eukprot:6190112-Pleurochrysis_carterae.AAC.1
MFSSIVLSESHLLTTVCCCALNSGEARGRCAHEGDQLSRVQPDLGVSVGNRIGRCEIETLDSRSSASSLGTCVQLRSANV